MGSDLLPTLLTNLWAVFLVVVLFGGSIFVHELGHFLAARRRGVKVERFSIGFGPPIWSHRARDGVEYRVSWFPLGGYVLLPQLADLGPIEGESQLDVSQLQPVSYGTKMIVFVAGAFFNLLFALALACIVWKIGQPSDGGLDSTTVAEVLATIPDTQGKEVPSPASRAGLKAGDVILAVDREPVTTFSQIREQLALSSGWTKTGERETIFTVRRGGQTMDVSIRPIISGRDKLRMVGIKPEEKLVIAVIAPGSPAERAGLVVDDQVIEFNGERMKSRGQFVNALIAAPASSAVTVMRGAETKTLTMLRPAQVTEGTEYGIRAFKTGLIYTHPTPFEQIVDSIRMTTRNLLALVNPRSDINASHLQGPIGIIGNFFDFARAGMPFVLWFTILVNVNLAVFNLLPLPVLDGGQMLFATIARLRGRPLPVNLIMTAQSVFLVLLLSMILYVSFFDVRRLRPDAPEKPAPAAAQKTGK